MDAWVVALFYRATTTMPYSHGNTLLFALFEVMGVGQIGIDLAIM